MKKLIVLFFVIWSASLHAQKTAGFIDYSVSLDYRKIIERTNKISEDERNRTLQMFKNDVYTNKYRLTFNENGSHFGYPPDRANSSWEKTETFIRRDFENNKVLEIIDLNSKIYIVEDSIYNYGWKIKTDIKEVAGYICMSASTVDAVTGHVITAWFTTDIPLPIGPQIYHGLPGAILELNIDNDIVVFLATSVNLKPEIKLPEIPKKLKGKKVNKASYEELVAKHTEVMSKSKNVYDISYRQF